MFFENQSKNEQELYKNFLKTVGSLSNLFSDSSIPYLYYRVAEKVFCKSFKADDLSRSDVSVDAKKEGLGIGLKTFLINNSKTFQKVAEFNNARTTYENLSKDKMIRKVSALRNDRIEITKKIHNLDNSIYHCVLRDKGKFFIYEEPMEKIDIEKIKDVKTNKGSISFSDGLSEYSFLVSKSTLTKRFNTATTLHEIDIAILEEPLIELDRMLFKKNFELKLKTKDNIKQTIYLPLYGKNKKVYEKSGLNQWNAGGRKRDMSEVYIQIPAKVNHTFEKFFPDRDTPFMLKLPNGNEMKSKICQDDNKALMSYSNKELGQWILRDVLELKEGELLNYKKLQETGIDSVRIDKMSDGTYEINFAEIGSFENFITQTS
jgi:hypothetical protein